MILKSAHKRIFAGFIFLLLCNAVPAQELSVQIATGLMNYGGDLQNKVYTFKQAQFSVSAAAIVSINKFSLKAGITHGKIQGDDISNTGYKFRNLSFATSINEISGAVQYDFFLLNETRKFTPYVFAGLGYFHFNPYTYYNGQKIFLKPLSTEGEGVSGTGKKFYQLSQFDYPIGIGFKYKVSDRILLGIEFNSRLLYTDYVDDVSTRYPDETTLFKERGQLAVNLSFRGNEIDPALNFPSNTHRGNPKQKDNFYTSVFTFTYILPGHTILSGGNGWRNTRSLNCPKITH